MSLLLSESSQWKSKELFSIPYKLLTLFPHSLSLYLSSKITTDLYIVFAVVHTNVTLKRLIEKKLFIVSKRRKIIKDFQLKIADINLHLIWFYKISFKMSSLQQFKRNFLLTETFIIYRQSPIFL